MSNPLWSGKWFPVKHLKVSTLAAEFMTVWEDQIQGGGKVMDIQKFKGGSKEGKLTENIFKSE